MGKFNVPTIGQTFILKNQTSLSIYNDYRNEKLIALDETLSEAKKTHKLYGSLLGTYEFKEGTEFKIARIYIRNGASEFDSITLTAKINKKSVRFWIKLYEFNTIEYK